MAVDFIERISAVLTGFIIGLNINWKLSVVLYPLNIFILATAMIVKKVNIIISKHVLLM